MKAIIHIGTEKTGTSTLQQTLFDNAKPLLKEGVAYIHMPYRIQCRDLAATCVGDDKPDEFLVAEGIHTKAEKAAFRQKVQAYYQKELKRASKKCHTVILSCEHFHSRLQDETMIERLRDCLQPHVNEFRIVCYLRRQVDLITSYYSTVLKSGGILPFKKHMDQMLKPERYYCNYQRLLANWQSVFGKEALSIQLFDRKKLTNQNIVDDFLSLCELDRQALQTEPEDTNESVDHLGQVLMRELNKSFQGEGPGTKSRKVIKTRKRIATAFAGKGEQLPASTARALQDNFDASNEYVRAQWFPREDHLFAKDFPRANQRLLTPAQERCVESVFALVASDGNYTGTLPDYNAYADVLRDTADLIQDKEPAKAYKLLELASKIRPNGPAIRRKLARLEARLNGEASAKAESP